MKKWFEFALHRGLQLLVIFGLGRFLLSLHWDKIAIVLPKFGQAIWMTVQLTAISLIIGLVLAWPLALLRAKRHPEWAARLADGFVAIFRGSPLLVQVYLIYYGLAGVDWIRESFLWVFLKDAYNCVLLAFSLNAAAYACEIFRGALVNGGKGEREAAMSLGLAKWQVDWLVWVPASWRRALPQYGNEMIFMMHGTALAGLITLKEVFGTAKDINSKFYLTYEGLIMAALIYVFLTICLSYFYKLMEKHFLGYLNRSQ